MLSVSPGTPAPVTRQSDCITACYDARTCARSRRTLKPSFERLPHSPYQCPHPHPPPPPLPPFFPDKTDRFISILKGSLHLFEINEATLHPDQLLPSSVLYNPPHPRPTPPTPSTPPQPFLLSDSRLIFPSIKACVDGKCVFKLHSTSNGKRCFLCL